MKISDLMTGICAVGDNIFFGQGDSHPNAYVSVGMCVVEGKWQAWLQVPSELSLLAKLNDSDLEEYENDPTSNLPYQYDTYCLTIGDSLFEVLKDLLSKVENEF